MFEKQSDMTYLVRGNNSSRTKSVFLKLLRFMFASISFDSHLTVFKKKWILLFLFCPPLIQSDFILSLHMTHRAC